MSRHNQDHHEGMEVHMNAQDGEHDGKGMGVAMSGDTDGIHTKSEGKGEKVKMNG